MTSARAKRRLAAVLVLGAVTLAGCSSGPDGVSGVAEGQDFRDCLSGSGLSVEGSGDWSAEEEWEFLSQPEVLDCVASAVHDERLPDAVGRAFGQVDFETAEATLTEYAAHETSLGAPPVAVANDAGRLAGALDPDAYEEFWPERLEEAIAWAIYTTAHGMPAGFEAWVEAERKSDDAEETQSGWLVSDYLDDLSLVEEGPEAALFEEIHGLKLDVWKAGERVRSS